VVRVVVWAIASLAVALAGLMVVTALVSVAIPISIPSGDAAVAAPAGWGLIFATIARQALLPHLALTCVSYVVAARFLKELERGIGSVLLGVATLATLAFPAVGAFSFTAWKPGGAGDYLATWLLLVAATSAALVLPRGLVPMLRPR
jgi:hypothetical protein